MSSNSCQLLPRQWDRDQIHRLQNVEGYSSGLIKAMSKYANKFPLRLTVIDNGESMRNIESNQVLRIRDGSKAETCTRWSEVQDFVSYHAEVAGLLLLPTRFIMLNSNGGMTGSQFFSVGEKGPNEIKREIDALKETMARMLPAGGTPLTNHVIDIQRYVSSFASSLRNEGRIITIVLATGGLPSDLYGNSSLALRNQFLQALKSLESLPVCLVIKLCTDDQSTVDFYNSIDSLVGIPVDVLDDYYSEALEIYLRNPWLNYGVPLHRFREIGMRVEVLDILDERALTMAEIHELCSFLFGADGTSRKSLPNPSTEWPSFLREVSEMAALEKQPWNPISRRFEPWINTRMLHVSYAGQAVPNYTPPSPYQQPQTSFQTKYQEAYSQSAPTSFDPYGQQRQIPQPSRNTTPGQQNQHQQQPKYHSQQQQQQQQQQPPQNSHAGQFQNSVPKKIDTSEEGIKKSILTEWALQPPSFQSLKPINELIGSVSCTFPPAYGVQAHAYFKKWKPFSLDALRSGERDVVKRAVKKMKFFLHPDKLPKDLTVEQAFVCKMLWDIIADAYEAFDP